MVLRFPRGIVWLAGVAGLSAFGVAVAATEDAAALVAAEFIFEHAPFAESHASTVVESRDGLVAAWFGGRHEKSPDVGIWLARRMSSGWSTPVEVANGVLDDGRRVACWNPVLYQPANGPLMLFYKVGPDPERWRGMLTTSGDGGRTWNRPESLPAGILGPAKNKPVTLADGTLLSPSSREQGGWRVVLERYGDSGWQQLAGPVDAEALQAIQPTLLPWSASRIQLLARSRAGHIAESWSTDGGKTWSALVASALPNPNSGIDAVRLRDGRALLVYNPTHFRRSPLSVAVSTDGRHWRKVLTLEEGRGEYSYPAVIQAADGLVHITYTWQRRRIRHVVLDPARLGTAR